MKSLILSVFRQAARLLAHLAANGFAFKTKETCVTRHREDLPEPLTEAEPLDIRRQPDEALLNLT